MAEKTYIAGRRLKPEGGFTEGYVIIEGGTIAEAGSGRPPMPPTVSLPPEAVILPGFIDLQINGGFGTDLALDPQGIRPLSQRLQERGVTAFLPTIISSPINTYPDVLKACDLTSSKRGAQPLGLHLEGPFLNPVRRGAHEESYLCLPTLENLSRLIQPAKVRLISLAPELPGGMEAIGRIREAGILPGIAHSDASYEEAKQAFEAGIEYGVHLFSAMLPLLHRQPGLVGALLEKSSPRFGIIADGIHLHPMILRMIYACRGAEGITLVSDAAPPAGMTPGTYTLGSKEVMMDGKQVNLPDGTLAGSAIFMDDAVRNMVRLGVCDLASAAQMASLTPAKVLGIDNYKGKIAPGFDADLVILNRDLGVEMTIISGKIAYQKS